MKYINKKTIAILAAICLSSLLGIACGVLSTQYSMPQTATAPVGASASFTIDGEAWVNGDSIDWGQLQIGANTKAISVTNTGSVAIASVTISSTGLPAGWTETITMGTPTGSSIPGTITLTADASVTGSQSWTSVITISGP